MYGAAHSIAIVKKFGKIVVNHIGIQPYTTCKMQLLSGLLDRVLCISHLIMVSGLNQAVLMVHIFGIYVTEVSQVAAHVMSSMELAAKHG